MNRKIRMGIICLALVAVLGGAGLLYNQLKDQVESSSLATQGQKEEETVENEVNDETTEKKEEGTEEESKIATIDFTVYDKEGKEVHLFDYIGKPIVLNFWASWCGPCQAEMPDFEEKYKEYGDEVHFLMINATGGRETKESAEAFLEEKGYSFPVFYDLDGQAQAIYGAYSLPMTYIIDKEGYVIGRASGMIDGDTLEEIIGIILE